MAVAGIKSVTVWFQGVLLKRPTSLPPSSDRTLSEAIFQSRWKVALVSEAFVREINPPVQLVLMLSDFTLCLLIHFLSNLWRKPFWKKTVIFCRVANDNNNKRWGRNKRHLIVLSWQNLYISNVQISFHLCKFLFTKQRFKITAAVSTLMKLSTRMQNFASLNVSNAVNFHSRCHLHSWILQGRRSNRTGSECPFIIKVSFFCSISVSVPSSIIHMHIQCAADNQSSERTTCPGLLGRCSPLPLCCLLLATRWKWGWY